MKLLRLAGSALCLLLALGFIGTAQAQAPDQGQGTFKLSACNKSGKLIIVAMAHRVSPASTERRFVVRGWFVMNPDDCGEIELPQGNFYHFAIAPEDGKYWGGDVGLCVNFKQPRWERVHNDRYACKADGELIAPFTGVQVTGPDLAIAYE